MKSRKKSTSVRLSGARELEPPANQALEDAAQKHSAFAQYDSFAQWKQEAFRAVGEARKRIQDEIGFYSEDQKQNASDFLTRLRRATRSTGRPRGNKTTAGKNQKMLEIFYRLAVGETLKEIAVSIAGDNYAQAQKGLEVRVKRFSDRVKKTFCESAAQRDGQIPPSFLEHKKSWGYLSSLFGGIEKWPGVIQGDIHHGYALCEALRRSQLSSQ